MFCGNITHVIKTITYNTHAIDTFAFLFGEENTGDIAPFPQVDIPGVKKESFIDSARHKYFSNLFLARSLRSRSVSSAINKM